MKTIAIVNRKGGVGKTTTAHSLGVGLRKKGFSVLFIDMDSQGNLTFSLGENQSHRQMEMLTKAKSVDEVIIHTDQGDLIPSGDDLATADMVLSNEYALADALNGIDYDYVIIDTSAALGRLTANALTASDTVIIPVQAELYSMQGIDMLYELIDAVKRNSNRKLSVDGILITRFSTRTTLEKDMRENLEKYAASKGTRVYKTAIRETVKVRESQFVRENIFDYSPRCTAAKDYKAFIEEFLS